MGNFDEAALAFVLDPDVAILYTEIYDKWDILLILDMVWSVPQEKTTLMKSEVFSCGACYSWVRHLSVMEINHLTSRTENVV